MIKKLKSKCGKDIFVGDLVVMAKSGNLHRGYITGITEKGFYITCEKKTFNTTWAKNTTQNHTYITYGDIDQHNNKQYVSGGNWKDLILLERSPEMPENLKKYLYTHQMVK